MYYTVGIKRKFWFGYKRYKVTNTFFEAAYDGMPIVPRLVLKLFDGSEISYPNLSKLQIKIYPNYASFKRNTEVAPPLPQATQQQVMTPQQQAEFISQFGHMFPNGHYANQYQAGVQ